MGRQLGNRQIGNDFSTIEHQSDYQLSRLTAAAEKLSRLMQSQATHAIAHILADLDNGECTNAGIEAVRQVRRCQTDYLQLAAELEAAASSFSTIERGLRQQLDTIVTDWEQRFQPARAAVAGGPVPSVSRRGYRRLFRRGYGPAPNVAEREPLAVPFDPAGRLALAGESAPPAPGAGQADIAALLLGPFEVRVAGSRVLKWTSLKARAILQYLLVHRDRPVRRDVLMSLQWPNHSYNSARNNLNVALCNLRNTLDWTGQGSQVILHKDGCYLLNPALVCWVDRNEFLANVHEARRARQANNQQRAIRAARVAVGLYRGPLFEDSPGGDWYLAEQRQLKELYLQSLEYLGQACLGRGQFTEAIEFGQLTITADPCYEPGHRLLMRCFAQQNQQQRVSRQYRLCSAALRDELDVAPAAETDFLFRALTSAC